LRPSEKSTKRQAEKLNACVTHPGPASNPAFVCEDINPLSFYEGRPMKKTRIYLDTSIISHLDAPETPEKMEDTLRLWEKIQKGVYDVVLSEIFFDELENCLEPKKSYLDAFLQQIRYERTESSNDTVSIARKFFDFGIFGKKGFGACHHIVAALLSGCDIIVSWNFKQIVNPRAMRGARAMAILEGYKELIVCSPNMLTEEPDVDDIPKPEISPAFTLEDIRKIREWNHERYKSMTPQEICEDTRRGAERFFASVKPTTQEMLDEAQRKIDEACGKHKKAS